MVLKTRTGTTARTGTIREVNFAAHSAELHGDARAITRLRFSAAQEPDLQAAANRCVTVTGRIVHSGSAKDARLVIDHIEIRDVNDTFWRHRDIAELAAEQGHRPHRMSAQRAKFWPRDLDPREFVALVNAGAVDDAGL